MAIEALRSEGHRTAEAEKSYEKFKSLHQGLLQKLAALQREETVTKPDYHEGASVPLAGGGRRLGVAAPQ
jgi:hypothetical protein